jgi:hypothetical protein
MEAKNARVDFIFYGGLLVIPFVAFLYIAISTGVSAEGKCQ